MNSNKINITICGNGRFIQKRILPVVLENNKLHLDSIIKSSNTNSSFYDCKYYNTLDECLLNKPTGIIYIASPNNLHAIQTIKSLNAGLNVLCEKPMAINKSECDQMLETAYKKGVHLQIGHQLRFSPAITKVKEYLNNDIIGELKKISIKFHYELPLNTRKWAYDHNISGGGCLMDAGIHAIDTIIFLTNKSNFEIVNLVTDSALHKDRLERMAICNFYNEEIVCEIDICAEKSYSTTLTLNGTKGNIFINDFAASWGTIKIECHNQLKSSYEIVDVSTIYANQINHFISKINNKDFNYSYTEDAALNVQFIQNIYNFI